MNEEIILELKFTKDEFIMLSFALGAEKIIGVEDKGHLQKVSSTELQTKWDAVRETLQKKRYIRNETKNNLEIDAAVYFLLSVCIEPKYFFSMQLSEKGVAKFHSNYYVSEEGIVSALINSNNDYQLAVKPYKSVFDLIDEIESVLIGLDKNNPDNSEVVSIALNKSKYYSFISALNLKNTEKAVEIFVTAGMKQEDAIDAVGGYVNKDKFVSFTCLTNPGDVESNEILMFYCGDKYCWNIETASEENSVFKLNKTSISVCIESIKQLLLQKCGSLDAGTEG